MSLPVDLDTQFGIGSVSKIFVAASVLILVQEGRLELDKPVTEYLPEFVMQDERYKDITVRILLNHTSGIPRTNNKDSMTAVKNRAFVQETLERLQTTCLINDPGRISVYCNDGFTVAEALVERVSGLSYSDFLEQNIFSEMGMTNTSTYFRDGNENVARVYEGESNFPLSLEYVNALASGGIASTAVDLCRYGEIFQPGSILSPAMLDEYRKAQYGPETVPTGSPLADSGLGWDQVQVYKFRLMGVDVLAKSGGTLQYCAELYVAPAQRISVAAIFAGYADPVAVTDAVLQAVLEDLGLVESSAASPVLPPEAEVPDSLKGIEGLYNSQLGLLQARRGCRAI